MRVSNKGLYPKRKPPLFRGGRYFYSDITDEIATEDIHLLDRNLLIEKTKEKIPNLTDDNKIGEIVESYINCCFLLKDK